VDDDARYGISFAQRYKHFVVLFSNNKEYSKTYFLLEGAPLEKERPMSLG
jgi:hypothetical protein